MDERQRAVALSIRAGLGDGHRVLNDPARVLLRHDLLGHLHANGTNRFRSHRADDLPGTSRYPAFIRHERQHGGSYTALLESRPALDAALAQARRKCRVNGADPSGLLVIEFVDTAGDDGIYRKYSAFRVGTRILARHVLFGNSWEVKKPDLVGAALLAEERDYIETNPHRDWLDQVFTEAAVDYGRIDYSMLDGSPQVWEINLNPTVLPRYAFAGGNGREDLHRRFARDFEEALAAVDAPPHPVPAALAPTTPAWPPPPSGRGATAVRRALRNARCRHLARTLYVNTPEPVLATLDRLVARRRR